MSPSDGSATALITQHNEGCSRGFSSFRNLIRAPLHPCSTAWAGIVKLPAAEVLLEVNGVGAIAVVITIEVTAAGINLVAGIEQQVTAEVKLESRCICSICISIHMCHLSGRKCFLQGMYGLLHGVAGCIPR